MGSRSIAHVFGFLNFNMSYCREEGKDRIIFVTEADHAVASNVALLEFDDEAEYEGLIKANGEINWECPCLGGMATGVCGEQFKTAFSCFHHSQSELKGSECVDQFRTMQECFNKYPDVYGEFESIEESDKDKDLFNEEDNEKDNEKEDGKKEQGGNGEIRISVDKEEEEPGSKSEKTVTS